MMDCAHARELMNSYIDGVLHEAESAAFEEHISCCENCHEEYDMLKKVSADLAKTSAPLPEGFAQRVHCALVEEKLKAEKKKFVFPYYRMASGLVAALVIAAVGKYGIYDTYKKVNKDTANMATQLANENVGSAEVALTASEDAAHQVEIKTAEPTYTKKTEEPVVAIKEQIIEDAVAETEVSSSGGVSVASEVSQFDVVIETEYYTSQNQSLMRSIIMEEPVPVSIDEMDEDKEVYDGSFADDETITEAPVEETASVTSPVPAVATVFSNNEGNMLMIKNFLLTFLEGSAVEETDEGITVTVSADDYESVVNRIRENSYIKSVENGVPFDGVGIIIIK